MKMMIRATIKIILFIILIAINKKEKRNIKNDRIYSRDSDKDNIKA